MEDSKTLVTLEHNAASGDHNAEMALIHHVADLYQTGQIAAVVKASGHASFRENQQEDVIDFNDISVHRKPDGSIAAVRRDASGRVAEIIHSDEKAFKFEYSGTSSNVHSMSTRQPDGGESVVETQPFGFTIRVNHEGDITFNQFAQGEATYEIDGHVSVYNYKTTIHGNGNTSGKFLVPDKITYKDGLERTFNLSDGQIIGYKEPESGEVFSRGTQYNAIDGSQYYIWKGDKGSRWQGDLQFVEDKDRTFSTMIDVTRVSENGKSIGHRIDVGETNGDIIRD
jgi:hypothetical protein